MDKKYQKCILTNMVMVYRGNEILVINRKKSDWPGLSFPGGHVEKNESIEESVYREIKEETGLILHSIKLCAIKEWKWEENNRYLGFLFKSDDFSGSLHSSKEGEIFWINKKDITKYPLSDDFLELFELIDKA